MQDDLNEFELNQIALDGEAEKQAAWEATGKRFECSNCFDGELTFETQPTHGDDEGAGKRIPCPECGK